MSGRNTSRGEAVYLLPLFQVTLQPLKRDTDHRKTDEEVDIDHLAIRMSSWLKARTTSHQTSTDVENINQKAYPCFHHRALRGKRVTSIYKRIASIALLMNTDGNFDITIAGACQTFR
jgi:hypothetical protein